MNQSFIEQIINYKINHITSDELVQLAAEYNIIVSKTEAKKIIAILKGEKISLSNQKQIERLLQKVKKEVNVKAMNQFQLLINQFLP